MSALNVQEWRPIPWAPGYEVSSDGLVGSWRRERNCASAPESRRILSLSTDKDGYRRVRLSVDGKHKDCRVPSLVAEAWHGSRPSGCVVRHLDGSKANDKPENLAWGTPKENSDDMIAHGTRVNGSRINTSRLSKEQVLEVLKSNAGHSDLARKFGVTPCAIWHIRAGRTWKHVGA